MVDLLDGLALGANIAFTPTNLLYCAIGVTIGMLVGVLPGVGTLATVSLLLPFTYHLEMLTALIMLAGIYYGAAYGGSTAAILLNLPGTANTAVTCLDGYPMSIQGRGGIALFLTTIASLFGSATGLVALVALAPLFSTVALSFGAAEYFSLALLGLIAAAMLSSGGFFRSLTMVVLGLLLGIVGSDINSGVRRFTFGYIELMDGVSLVAVAMGLFGVPEVIGSAGRHFSSSMRAKDISWRSMLPTAEDWRRSWMPMLRGSSVGGFFGALPGAGGAVATFVAYAVEKRVSKDPSRFGKGAVEGITSPEAANNSAIQTAFIPTLTLGIPGDAVMALMLGVFLIHGVVPGPALISNDPGLFWGLIVSFIIGNMFLLLLNLPLIGVWIRILTIPYGYLYPAIIVFVCLGVYSVQMQTFDIVLVAIFGFIGYGMRLLRFEPAPLLLGLILGPMMEENLRRALLLSRGDPMILFERPISAGMLATVVVLLATVAWTEIRQRQALKRARV